MDCPECGAPGEACKAQFQALLAREFTDPGFGAVHHLTVTAYMLQHSSQLSREGWLYEREMLRRFLLEGQPPALVRRQARPVLDSGRRRFKIASNDGRPLFGQRAWAKTIMNVRMGSADVYHDDVAAWARAVLEEALKIEIPSSGGNRSGKGRPAG